MSPVQEMAEQILTDLGFSNTNENEDEAFWEYHFNKEGTEGIQVSVTANAPPTATFYSPEDTEAPDETSLGEIVDFLLDASCE